MAQELIHHLHRGVASNPQHWENTLMLAVLRHHPEARPDGGRHIRDLNGFAIQQHFARIRPAQTKQAFHRLAASGSHKAGKAQHLALPQGKARVLNHASTF